MMILHSSRNLWYMHKRDIVYIEQYHFSQTWEKRNKYFVVLSDTWIYLDIIFVFTTSKIEKYSWLREEEKVLIPVWSIECFDRDTMICIKNIHKVDKNDLLKNKIEVQWRLPSEIFDELLDKIHKSPYIKPYIKKLLLGNRWQ